jgi:ribonucleotide reductase alpha subunit
VVKSGGKTRRAAKMVILNTGHPDILDFVDSKASEERKAWALIEAGYDPSFTGEAYGSVFFQNANHSVRASDQFMNAVENDDEWTTYEVTSGDPAGSHKARTILRHMAEAAWVCGDPGIQYDTTINDWNPVANTDRQHATNPCSEFSFINDTSCNLASLNLMKFADGDGGFDVEAFRYWEPTGIALLVKRRQSRWVGVLLNRKLKADDLTWDMRLEIWLNTFHNRPGLCILHPFVKASILDVLQAFKDHAPRKLDDYEWMKR